MKPAFPPVPKPKKTLATGPEQVDYDVIQTGSLFELMSRDLDAWRAAKAVIAAAMAR